MLRRYWYPLSYCLSLALQPSGLIGLNADLKLPKLQVGAAWLALRLMPCSCQSVARCTTCHWEIWQARLCQNI